MITLLSWNFTLFTSRQLRETALAVSQHAEPLCTSRSERCAACSDRPGMLEMVKRAKFDAWKKLASAYLC